MEEMKIVESYTATLLSAIFGEEVKVNDSEATTVLDGVIAQIKNEVDEDGEEFRAVQLPKNECAVVGELHDKYGKSVSEIATQLSVGEEVVKSSINRFLRVIRNSKYSKQLAKFVK